MNKRFLLPMVFSMLLPTLIVAQNNKWGVRMYVARERGNYLLNWKYTSPFLNTGVHAKTITRHEMFGIGGELKSSRFIYALCYELAMPTLIWEQASFAQRINEHRIVASLTFRTQESQKLRINTESRFFIGCNFLRAKGSSDFLTAYSNLSSLDTYWRGPTLGFATGLGFPFFFSTRMNVMFTAQISSMGLSNAKMNEAYPPFTASGYLSSNLVSVRLELHHFWKDDAEPK